MSDQDKYIQPNESQSKKEINSSEEVDDGQEICPVCLGSGECAGNYFSDDGMETCRTCGGRGVIY